MPGTVRDGIDVELYVQRCRIPLLGNTHCLATIIPVYDGVAPDVIYYNTMAVVAGTKPTAICVA